MGGGRADTSRGTTRQETVGTAATSRRFNGDDRGAYSENRLPFFDERSVAFLFALQQQSSECGDAHKRPDHAADDGASALTCRPASAEILVGGGRYDR